MDWLAEKVVDFDSSSTIAGAKEVVGFFISGKFLADGKDNCSVLGKHWGMYRVEGSKQIDVHSRE